MSNNCNNNNNFQKGNATSGSNATISNKFHNLEQIRAKNAISWIHDHGGIGAGEEGGDKIEKKIPSLIIDNGIIATLAFAIEKSRKNAKGYSDVFLAIISHLKDKNIALYAGVETLDAFFDYLTVIDSKELRKITAETMAFLNYLRRLD